MRLWESRTPPGFILGAADREIRGPPFFALACSEAPPGLGLSRKRGFGILSPFGLNEG